MNINEFYKFIIKELRNIMNMKPHYNRKNVYFLRFHRRSAAFLYKPYYDNQSEWLRINSYASTGQAIKAPFTFYYVNNNDWSDSHSYQFWNKNFTSDSGITNAAIAKTIYSPSPSGFVEPKTAAFTGFTSTGGNSTKSSQFNVSGSFTKGYYFYTNGWKTGSTIFFDCLGYRNTYGVTGAVVYVGEEGGFWAYGALSASHGRGFYCSTDQVHSQLTDFRSIGYSVLSVKE